MTYAELLAKIQEMRASAEQAGKGLKGQALSLLFDEAVDDLIDQLAEAD